MRLEEYVTTKDIELINRTIDGVVKRLLQDAEAMDINPRQAGKAESIVERTRRIAEWVDQERNDIIFDTFGIDLGD